MRFSKIKDNDIVNGSGINMSLWTQGCPHQCKGCFNPETWKFNEGKEFKVDDLNYILENINKNNIKRNLSVLGGEPLCSPNIDGVLQLCKVFKKIYPEKKIYLWTGYLYEEFDKKQKEILKYIDVLVDGKFEENKKNISLSFRGSSNQRIIDIAESLEKNYTIIYDEDSL